MVFKTYLDFHLLLESIATGYRARILSSPSGEGVSDFTPPVPPPERDALFAQFGRLQFPLSNPLTDRAQATEALGRRLFDSLFQGEVRTAWGASKGIAQSQAQGLRLHLHLTDVPELGNLPWELLHDDNDFLALSVGTPVLRYLELQQTIRPLAVQPPVRALIMISSPSDYPELDAQGERDKLGDSLGAVIEGGLFQMDTLMHASLSKLQQRLRDNEYHILHFIGHGDFDEHAKAGALILESESGGSHAVSPDDLATILRDCQALRLAVLNSCESARAATGSAFSGVAQALLRAGIPAALAMQFPISEAAAQIFARELYALLAKGAPVDTALGEARKAMWANQFALEWATPVLYTRASDSVIFDVADLTPAEELALKIGALVRRALNALDAEDFSQATEAIQAALDLEPGNPRARAVQSQIQRTRDAAGAYAEGKAYVNSKQWREAIDAFRRVQSLAPNYKEQEVNALAAQAQTNLPISVASTPGDTAPDPLAPHFDIVARAILKGELVPFLGAGVNAVGRPSGQDWARGEFVPNGRELANYLANSFGYNDDEDKGKADLGRVSQYAAVMSGMGPLYSELHSIFDKDYPPTPLHDFLAGLPALLRQKGVTDKFPIIITTNYDDLLERAFKRANEAFDLLTYLAEGEKRGKFVHRAPDGTEQVIDIPNEYRQIHPEQWSVIIKIHGAVSRGNPDRDSFVITEDDYIDYLTHSDISALVPITLQARLLKNSHFLFMGYSLRDWNLRVLLYRIWGEQKLSYNSWAIQLHPQDMDRQSWQRRNVEIKDKPLDEYIVALQGRLRELRTTGVLP